MAERRPAISVLVPFRNSAAHLERCIRGLQAQDIPADCYELILIDNNSTDGSRAVAAQFAGVQVLTEAKPGAYAARNRGVAQARGEIVAFIDADCAADSAWLRRHSQAMAEPGVEVVLGSRKPGRRTTALHLMSLYEDTKAAAVFSGTDEALYYGYTNNMSVRKRTLVEFGGFREVLRGADSVFIRQLVEQRGCGVIRYCPEASITHLEVRSLRQWYRKYAIYGRSNQWNSRTARTCLPMTLGNRWRTYRAAVRQHSLGFRDAARLLGILVGGGISYEMGRLAGRVVSRG